MKYVLLLRGIAPLNPAMSNSSVKGFLEDLGFKNIIPVIASGNYIFDLPAGRQGLNTTELEEKIEKALPKKLGFSSKAIIRSQEQIEKLVSKDPLKGKEDVVSSRFNVTFLKKAPHEITFTVDTSTQGNTPNKMLELEKKYGKEITTRTWKTVMRILKKMTA